MRSTPAWRAFVGALWPLSAILLSALLPSRTFLRDGALFTIRGAGGRSNTISSYRMPLYTFIATRTGCADGTTQHHKGAFRAALARGLLFCDVTTRLTLVAVAQNMQALFATTLNQRLSAALGGTVTRHCAGANRALCAACEGRRLLRTWRCCLFATITAGERFNVHALHYRCHALLQAPSLPCIPACAGATFRAVALFSRAALYCWRKGVLLFACAFAGGTLYLPASMRNSSLSCRLNRLPA